MDDLKFENQLLKAEVVTLRLEKQAASERQRVQDQSRAALSLQVREIETVKSRVKILQQENTRLRNALTQMEAKEVEIKTLRGKIAELEHSIKNYSESDHEKEIGNLAKLMMKQDDIIRGLNKDARALQNENNKLWKENKAFAAQLEQVQEEINGRDIRTNIFLFALGSCTMGGLVIAVFILKMVL
ncbi:MAG TPA: hypothetical protein VGO50_02500 [Pyrinomonadaceae bacterium]|jgi:chromosome segregation ATPase|nr:hypothetical protein [Pyrinomonadaceae bacterium]